MSYEPTEGEAQEPEQATEHEQAQEPAEPETPAAPPETSDDGSVVGRSGFDG